MSYELAGSFQDTLYEILVSHLCPQRQVSSQSRDGRLPREIRENPHCYLFLTGVVDTHYLRRLFWASNKNGEHSTELLRLNLNLRTWNPTFALLSSLLVVRGRFSAKRFMSKMSAFLKRSLTERIAFDVIESFYVCNTSNRLCHDNDL